ncbi:MAG: peptidoglycan DD-metalloendopeptidase family protein [Clostridium sp.]|nr:peptidoglycan DD-metalloendopeptidase family protein [Clostridium sp.]
MEKSDYPNTDSYDLNGVRNQGPINVALCFSQLAPGRYYYVVVQHSGRYWTRYAHMASADVSVGQQVDCGTRLGDGGGRQCGWPPCPCGVNHRNTINCVVYFHKLYYT